jgi:hypothetical protein
MPFLRIDLHQADKMSTPVKHLWPDVHKALKALPENVKQELLETGACLEIALIDSPRFICDVEVATRKMRISTGCMQMLWTCGYLNMMYWDKLYKAGGLTKTVVMDPENDLELQQAYKLFEWSLNVVEGKITEEEWPSDLPQPMPDASRDSWKILADELTLEAVGYLILHEMAHVYSKHSPSSDSSWSIEQEKDADALAVQWLFQGEKNTRDGHQTKRALATASVFLMQCAVALFTGEWGGKSHPPRWQRLDQVMRKIADDPAHPLFAFLGHLAQMYRTMARGPSGPAKFADFLDAFDQFIETLSKEHQAQDCAP